MSKPSDRPLRCTVKNGVLTIEIGVATLAFAALRSPFAYEMMGDNCATRPDTRFSIANARGFAKDVVREMTREEEDGTTPLDTMLDEVTRKAIEDGSEYFLDSKEEP